MSFEIIYALHNFHATNDDEITFNVGDPIAVLEKDEKYMDGWWKGQDLHGHVGLFPASFTTSRASPFYDTSHPENTRTPPTQVQHCEEALMDRIDEVISMAANVNNVTDIPTPQWESRHVATWLESIHLGSLATQFIDQEITGDILLTLDHDSLKELGVMTYGKRYRLLVAVESLRKNLTPKFPKDHCATLFPHVNAFERYNSTETRHSLQQPLGSRSGLQDIGQNPYHPPPHRLYSHKTSDSRICNTQTFSDSITSVNTMPADISKTQPLFSGIAPTATTHSFPETRFRTRLPAAQRKQRVGIHNSRKTCSDPSFQSGALCCRLSVDLQSKAIYEPPEHEGWLYKQNNRYTLWKKRWCVLRGNQLFYYKHPEDILVKGVVDLYGYRITPGTGTQNGRFYFKALHDSQKTLSFYSDSKEAAQAWIKVLLKTTIKRDTSLPVMASSSVATVSLQTAQQMHPRPPSTLMHTYGQRWTYPTAFTPKRKRNAASRRHKKGWSSLDYLDWLNAVLGPEKPVKSPTTVSHDRDILLRFLETLGRKHGQQSECISSDMRSREADVLDVIASTFKRMRRDGAFVDGQYTMKGIRSCDEDKIRCMLDTIVEWTKERDTTGG